MIKKLVFDTLNYAKMLSKGNVEHADTHASSLATALQQNVYIKSEIDMKFEKALQEFRRGLEEDRARHDVAMLKIELRFEKAVKRMFVSAITILGTLIVIINALTTFAHSLFH